MWIPGNTSRSSAMPGLSSSVASAESLVGRGYIDPVPVMQIENGRCGYSNTHLFLLPLEGRCHKHAYPHEAWIWYLDPDLASPEAGIENWQDIAYSARSEEHTSELQSRQYLVCRLLLE